MIEGPLAEQHDLAVACHAQLLKKVVRLEEDEKACAPQCYAHLHVRAW